MDYARLLPRLPPEIGRLVWGYSPPRHPVAGAVRASFTRCWCGSIALKVSATARGACALTRRHRRIEDGSGAIRVCGTCRCHAEADAWEEHNAYFCDVWGVGVGVG